MTRILELRQVTKSFGGLNVLNGLDLTVAKNEIRCLIGPNGSGKSTLLKTVLGLHRPDSGEIRYLGQRIDGMKPFEIVRAGLSIKFQIVSIYRELSVYQNLRIPTQRLDQDEDVRAEAIDEMLDLIRLAHLSDTEAGTLSHGQQQWLEIGMAIANGPQLLLLDEPTAGMTPDETRTTADIVRRLNKDKGISVVAVEHDMNFVRYLDTRVSVLHQGTIFFEGSLDEIRANPEIQKIYFGSRK